MEPDDFMEAIGDVGQDQMKEMVAQQETVAGIAKPV
jgi:hypothetical protein